MIEQDLTDWLLDGDVSIQSQVWRDLPGNRNNDLRKRIATESRGAKMPKLAKARYFIHD